MNATVEQLEGHRVALEVEVPPERVAQALDGAYRRLARRVNIPGFRKGKAPRALVERHVGKAALWDDVLNDLVSEAYQAAVAETGIEPIDQPQVDLKPGLDEDRVAFRAEVPVKPDVQLGDYKSIRMKVEPETVSDDDVEQRIAQLRERMAQLSPVEEERPVEQGDYVVIDFVGRLKDGTPIEHGSATGHTVEVGSGSLIEGIEAGMVGMRPDETRTIEATFPDPYGAEELAGQEAAFDVTVREIKRRELPELDDAFAAEAGEYASLEEMRVGLKKGLEDEVRTAAERQLQEQVRDQVVDGAQVDLPDILLDRRQAELRESMERQLQQAGLTLEAYLEQSGKTTDDYDQDLRKQAERDVKTDLVLDAVAKAEQIEPDEAALRAEIERVARQYGSAAGQIRQLLSSDPDNLANVRASLRMRLAMERLAEIAGGDTPPADAAAAADADAAATEPLADTTNA